LENSETDGNLGMTNNWRFYGSSPGKACLCPSFYDNGRVSLLAKTVLVLLFCLASSSLRSQPVNDQTSGLTFESFFQHPPVVRHAAYEIIYGNTTNLREPHDLSRTFVLDGTNFLTSEVPIGEDAIHKKGLHFCGELKGVRWRGGGWGNVGLLMMFDPSINTNSSDPKDAMYWDRTSPSEIEAHRQDVNLLMHLGIEDIVPGSIIWQPGATNFSARFRGPGSQVLVVSNTPGGPPTTNYIADERTLLIQLTYDRNVVIAANVKYSDVSENVGYLLKYEYTNAFCNGHLPSGWTVFDKNKDNGSLDISYKVQIRDLELAEGELPSDLLDPRKALAKEWKQVGITSNNVAYWLKRRGGMARILTAQEAQAREVKRTLDRDPSALGRARMLIVGAFLVPPLLFTLYRRNRKAKV
jgi:hypothetical protein